MDKRLSQIKYNEILFKASKLDMEQIVFEDQRILKDEKDVSEEYDFGLIFGNASMIPLRADKGIELYRKQIVRRLIVSGGIGFLNTDRIVPEADKMQQYLLERGIPEEDIIVERFSRNTVENIQNSLQILNSRYDNVEKMRFALITSDFHVRRCLGLFEKQLGKKENVIGCGALDGVNDIQHWSNSFTGKRHILIEAMMLCMYAKQNRLDDIEISNLAFQRVRNRFK